MEPIKSGPRVHDAPEADRPRERLLSLGAPALRTAELLAILIRSGRTGESALQAGEKIAAHFKDQLDRLADAGRGELHEISPATAETAYCQIMAGIELGRRVVQAAQARGGDQQKTHASPVPMTLCFTVANTSAAWPPTRRKRSFISFAWMSRTE